MVDNVHDSEQSGYGKCHRDYTNPAFGGVKGEKQYEVDVVSGYPYEYLLHTFLTGDR